MQVLILGSYKYCNILLFIIDVPQAYLLGFMMQFKLHVKLYTFISLLKMNTIDY